jgi:uncharacterized damage-inducible protein DinB
MLSEAQRREFILVLERLPLNVEAAVRNLSEGQLDAPHHDGGWTVRQVVHHLADAHLQGFASTKAALTEERPSLLSFDQDKWAALADVRMPVQFSLWILRGVHERWVGLLRSLAPEDWERTAVDSERGVITVDELLASFARHGRYHVGEIHDMRDRAGW